MAKTKTPEITCSNCSAAFHGLTPCAPRAKALKWIDGPWYVGSMNDALFVLTRPPSPSGTDAPLDTRHEQQVIAKIETGAGHVLDSALAALIATAPELYAALEAMVDAIENPGRMSGFLLNQARAALAKARGESQ